MSALLRLALFALPACAAQPTAAPATPAPVAVNAPGDQPSQWHGPAVRAEFAKDGSLRITMTAPTASHELALQSVAMSDGKIVVRCVHTSPGDVVVAQVLTQLVVVVPKEQLPADAKVALVEIASARRDRPKDPPSAYCPAATVQRGQ